MDATCAGGPEVFEHLFLEEQRRRLGSYSTPADGARDHVI